MSILDTIKSRRSVRGFQDKEISQDIIDDLIEALIWAPSAGNLQSRKFYFVTNQEIKDKLTEAALSQDFIRQAPLVIVGCADLRIERKYGERGKNLYSIQDVALSIQNLMLVAKEYGLGTCWVGAFEEDKVRAMGRGATGVRGISLRGEDEVVDMVVAEDDKTLFTGTENGYGREQRFLITG